MKHKNKNWLNEHVERKTAIEKNLNSFKVINPRSTGLLAMRLADIAHECQDSLLVSISELTNAKTDSEKYANELVEIRVSLQMLSWYIGRISRQLDYAADKLYDK